MQKVLNWLVSSGKYLLVKVLPFVAGVGVVAAFSFLFTGGFNFTLLSERVFWAGLLVFLVAGTVALAQMVSGKALLFPYNIRKPEDAKKFVDEMPAMRETAEKRLDVGIQLWLIGLGCLGLSAMIQSIFG